MGLASSQARMLLLTARKSDLEYRAQMISQRKINLAMQTEALASKYSKSMANRTMNFVFTTADGAAQTEKLSYRGLVGQNESAIGDYLVKTSTGKYVYSGANQNEKDLDFVRIASKLAAADGKSGDYEKYYGVDAEGNRKVKDSQGLLKALQTAYASKMTYVQGVQNDDFFQDSLRNGGLFLEKADMSTDGTKSVYKNVSWSAVGTIQDVLDTTDDAEAEAEYESKSIVLSNQDKMLDLELNQIETQHKAIETEYDSVKKVIQKNIEVSYKIFA